MGTLIDFNKIKEGILEGQLSKYVDSAFKDTWGRGMKSSQIIRKC